MPDVGVEPRFDGFVLGENELLAGLTGSGGTLLFRRTDASGEIVLVGVDPLSLDAPEIAVPGAAEPVTLTGYRPGETIVLTVAR